jgi:hypothetical protein
MLGEIELTVRSAEISPHIYARVAGSLYLIIIVFGIFSEALIRSILIVPGDAVSTVNNIHASE